MNFDINRFIHDYFGLDEESWKYWEPSQHTSRQSWQEFTEELLRRINTGSKHPPISLSEAEISRHYHLPIIQFSKMVSKLLL